MKMCHFAIEAFFGIPINYENWFEHMCVELTEEQFERYCAALERWTHSEEWKKWNTDNGEDFFIKRDLPDIYDIIKERLTRIAPLIWDDRINDYLDQIRIYTADEIWEALQLQQR